MNKKKQLIQLLEEKHKRKKLNNYQNNFTDFASDNIKIITKDARRGFVNFTFNDCQKKITEILDEQLATNGKVRAIILKARQQGISTYCAGRVFWKTYFTPHARSVVMAHDSATSDALFNMSRNIIRNMDSLYKPTELRSNAKEIVISSPHFKKDATGEKPVSSYRLYTAGSPEAGRGTTPTIAHLSEIAFWQHDEKILAGLFQGISEAPGTEVILESTANGAQGEFYRLWRGALNGENEYTPIFLPWFTTSEYYREPPEDFERSSEEELLVEDHNLNNGQLYWRRLKIAEGGELKFRQEYPATPDEAFITAGKSVFAMDKLKKLLPAEPDKRMIFDFNSFTWEASKDGNLDIWEFPDWDSNYILAADVALGVGQDYSAAVVMDTDRKVIALYRDNYIDPSKFGDLLFYLGRYYNNALLTVESNSMGVATLSRLAQMNYINLYKQTKISAISKEEGMVPGFKTTQVTKPHIIGNLKNAVENDDIWIASRTIIQELKDYVSTDSGRTEAAPGCHDDTIMATAIALETLRTHYDKLTMNKVPWSQKADNFLFDDDTQWL
tara:strand:- start:2467 stop:4137 length:1671 start_codon:yes stop_codon:yes gene_type:complete